MVATAQRHQSFQAQKKHQAQQQQPPQTFQQQKQQQRIEEPQVESKYRHIPIVSYQNVQDHDGSFNYAYENGDGTRQQQTGQLKQSNFDPKNVGEAVQGEYSYQGDDGQNYQVTYIADEFGYRAQGAHLPTP